MGTIFHLFLGWALLAATGWLVAFHVPPKEATIGGSYLIFFVHFPAAVSSLVLFLAAGVLSAAQLFRRRAAPPGPEPLDAAAATAVEVGMAGCTITLVTGSIWAKAAWGLWWDAGDPRLMTVAVLWLTYAAYLVLRASVDDPLRRARFSAVFGVLAALNVPLVHFALRIFRALHHPPKVELASPEMVFTRWFGAASFLILLTALWRLRYRLAVERSRLSAVEESSGGSENVRSPWGR